MSNNEYEIEQDLPDHNWRTELPNIIFEMGLDCFSISLYAAIKKIAGDQGRCFAAVPSLCDLAGMKPTKLRQTLKELESGENNFKTPLISITPRLKEDGSSDTNIIRILPIWRLNGSYYRAKQMDKQKTTYVNVGGGSRHEGGVVRDTKGGTSPHDDKEDPSEEDLFEEERDLSSSSFSPYKENKKAIQFSPQLPPRPLPELHERPDEMDELDINDDLALRLIKEYPVTKLKKAIQRTLAWKTRLNDEAGLMAVLKNFDNWNDYTSPEAIAEENKKHLIALKHWEGKKLGIATVSVGPDYIEFITGPTHTHAFYIKDRDFKKECDIFMSKLVSK